MLKNHIVAREREIAILNRIYDSKEAEFIAVYGRRRVGKTFLIRSFFNQKKGLFFQLAGIHNASISTQLNEFTKELQNFYAKININVTIKPPVSWLNAFEMLNEAIKHTNQKIVLFFDEFPWMASKKSQLLEAVDYYWNRHWVDNPHLKLIICGSAASWIIDNILNNKGGLHNRVTLRLPIQPFTLAETKAYLTHRKIYLDHQQILQLYLCIGGIPFYLKLVKEGLSAVQNINDICFNRHGGLANEFNNLFSSLFQHSDIHEAIINLLASKRNGVARQVIELATQLKGGGLTRVLNELEQAGFIEKFLPWKQQKGLFYKLIDEYSLFYLNWISPQSKTRLINGISEKFWQIKSQSASWRAWAGYAFEAICFKHLKPIRKALAIPDDSEAATWRHTAKKDELSGAQIDLLFDRSDGITSICEIKYSSKPFKINKEYAQALKNKLDIYKKVTKTNKQLCLSMITANGLEESPYREGLIWSIATSEDLF